MRRRAVSDADAAAQQDRHPQPPAAHVLHLRDLVDEFAERVVEKIHEHEINHRPRARHRRAATETDKTALANRRVAQTLRSVFREQSGGRPKIPPAHANALAENKDPRIARHLEIQRLHRRRRE